MSAAGLLGTTAAPLPAAAAAITATAEDQTFGGIFEGLWRISHDFEQVRDGDGDGDSK